MVQIPKDEVIWDKKSSLWEGNYFHVDTSAFSNVAGVFRAHFCILLVYITQGCTWILLSQMVLLSLRFLMIIELWNSKRGISRPKIFLRLWPTPTFLQKKKKTKLESLTFSFRANYLIRLIQGIIVPLLQWPREPVVSKQIKAPTIYENFHVHKSQAKHQEF